MKLLSSRRALAAIAVATLALTACGTDGSDSRTSSSPASATALTIDHQFGQTRITGTPQRVVTVIGPAWSDALIRLQVPIVGEFVTQGYSGVNNRFEWTPEHDAQITTVPSEVGVPSVEQVAALRPDIILSGYLPNQAAYEQLSQIAPTIPVMTKGALMDPWQDVTTAVGRIFGKQSQAQGAISEVEKKISDTRAAFPAAQGKIFVFGQLTPNNQFGLVTSPTDPATKLVASLGLSLFPAVQELSKDGQRALVSPERIDVLRADALLLWPLTGGPEAFETIPGWQNLPAVRTGATLFLDNANASAFGAPTIYSVPWAIAKLTPTLAKLQ